MEILVTGAAGFLGRRVAAALVAAGHTVRLTDVAYRRELPAPLRLANLTDPLAIYPLLEGVEAVIHLGNIASVEALPAPELYTTNCRINFNVLQAAIDLRVPRFLFASSIQVVVPQPVRHKQIYPVELPYFPFDSAMPPRPGNAYALSKLAGEQALECFSRLHPTLAAASIRLPALDKAASEGPLERYTPQPEYWSHREAYVFLPVEEAARFLTLAVVAVQPGYRVWFPAARENRTGLPAAELIATYYPQVPLRRPLANIDSVVDLTQVTADTGWQPAPVTFAE